MAYKTVVYDDDPKQAEALRQKILHSENRADLEIATLSDWTELGALLAHDAVDILLMDIQIEGEERLNGIDIVRHHMTPQSPLQVIYVTGHDGYHAKAYRTKHISFLTKPVDQGELDEALERAVKNITLYSERPFWVKTAQGEKVIVTRKIRWIESNRRVLRIYTEGEVVETYGRLSDLAEKLPERFVQCHKSFIVNMGYIDEFGRSDVTLTTGEKIPVSQKRRSETRDAFFAYIGREL